MHGNFRVSEKCAPSSHQIEEEMRLVLQMNRFIGTRPIERTAHRMKWVPLYPLRNLKMSGIIHMERLQEIVACNQKLEQGQPACRRQTRDLLDHFIYLSPGDFSRS